MPCICFFMPISIQTERQKEINIFIKMIYHSRPQRKLNMLLGQHVSKTKQTILVVTFGKCSILSQSFEFSCFGIIIFVVRIFHRIVRSFTSFVDNHICHMFTFAFYCPHGLITSGSKHANLMTTADWPLSHGEMYFANVAFALSL